jgi:hypothetical protein
VVKLIWCVPLQWSYFVIIYFTFFFDILFNRYNIIFIINLLILLVSEYTSCESIINTTIVKLHWLVYQLLALLTYTNFWLSRLGVSWFLINSIILWWWWVFPYWDLLPIELFLLINASIMFIVFLFNLTHSLPLFPHFHKSLL